MKFELDENVRVDDETSVYHGQIGKVLGRHETKGVEKYVLGFQDDNYTGDFVGQQLKKLITEDAPHTKVKPSEYEHVVTAENLSYVAEWCGGEIRGDHRYKYIVVKTGFSDNPDYRSSLHIGDTIEKRDDGKFQIWVGGEPKDQKHPWEDRPYMKKGRDFNPLAEAVAFVNAGFYDGKLATDDVYIVWFCSTVQNWKALVSTNVKDNAYYEVTHNGEKNETYVDRYVKVCQLKVDRATDEATYTPEYDGL